jgi:uncharacterized protein
MELFAALIVGIIVGGLFHLARISKYDVQIAAMQFKDMAIFKFMLSSTIIAMIGFYIFDAYGIMEFKPKPLFWSDTILGGILFGIGWGLLGFCPGTGMAAVGEGKIDAVVGIGGMLTGAALYAYTFEYIAPLLPDLGGPGKVTLPVLFDINPWVLITLFIAVFIAAFIFFEKKDI